MLASRGVRVALGERSYEVVIAPDFVGLGARLRALSRSGRVVVGSDTTVATLWLDALRSELEASGFELHSVVIPPGEEGKDREAWWRLVDGFVRARGDRRTPFVALGGGVVGDLVGFAAASVLRGVPFVQVPTTLLAMVDSSVGGKTGFNHELGKNLIGAFYQPDLVWAPLAALGTLPVRERSAGLGEVLKTAWIADAAFVDWLEAEAVGLRAGERGALAEAVARCVRIKAEVVAQDERESGRRAILNAGHTVGHGVEAAAGYGVVLHGEAVAIGLLHEALWAAREGLDRGPALVARLRRLLGSLGLPCTVDELGVAHLSRTAVLAAMELDKKASSDMLTLPVCRAEGSCHLAQLPLHRLAELISELS